MLLATMTIGLSIRAIAALHGVVDAAPAGADAAAYMVLTNLSGTENRLTGISCDCAERVELHEMAGEGADRAIAVRPSLAMPPQQLTEFTPGGLRQLKLTSLRRPLVAGEWIEMSFQYEQGTTTERFQVVDDTRIAWGRSIDPTQVRGAMASLAFLAASCWRGTFPDGRQTDTHCFSPIYSGSYMQDRHVVLGAPAPYSGVTLYHRDYMSRTVRFTYRASDGSVTNGGVVPIEGGLSFPEVHRAADGAESQIRTTWLRDGPDAYNVRSEMQQRGGGWRTMFNMRMVRIGAEERAP
jgi:copper(I)-binding protein